MHDVGLTHVALPVTNIERSVAFYAKYAQMDVVHQRDRAVWLSDKTRPFVIVLLQVPKVDSPLLPMAHLGVGCESRDEVDRLVALADQDDALVGGPMDSGPPVGYWAFLEDPDGHTLEIAHGQEVGPTVERAKANA